MKFYFIIATALLLGISPIKGAETVAELMSKATVAARGTNLNEAIALASKALQIDPNDSRIYFTRAQIYARIGDHAKALADLDKVAEAKPDNAQIYNIRGMENFKLSRIDESITDFDHFIKLMPSLEAQHWQRGISYYYAGRYAEGKKQFELHQTVNPSDVENAVWHFLCAAKVEGFEKARAHLIAIPEDPRIPMMTIHSLFEGKAKPADVLAKAQEGNPNPDELKARMFYAHLYLGLYFESLNDSAQAKQYISKAAKEYSQDHYMGAVAKVHLALLEKSRKTG